MTPPSSRPDWSGRTIHLVGIGGAGMSGIARVARSLGATVSGSDREDSAVLDRLRAAGVSVTVGHSEGAVPDGAEVVRSSAIDDRNPEVVAALARASSVVHRVDLLAELAALKRAIVVVGTHGKTTTTAMIAHVLAAAGVEPAYFVGGDLRSTGTNAAWGDGEWAVVEGDESDGSFLSLEPEIAVITNVELDHHARWRSLGDLQRAFLDFMARARIAIVHEALARELPELRGEETLTYGIDAGVLAARDLETDGFSTGFSVDGTRVRLPLPGRHNVENALAALGACGAAGLETAAAANALASFEGAGRRFEERGVTAGGARIVDDYAHHPTEVGATLAAARALAPNRVVACFQPHLYSRTKHLAREFGRALALADVVVVLDVYPARELAADFPGVSGWLVATRAADAAAGRPVYWAPSIEDAERMLPSILEPDDLVLTMGAGDIDRLAEGLAEGAAR